MKYWRQNNLKLHQSQPPLQGYVKNVVYFKIKRNNIIKKIYKKLLNVPTALYV